LDRIPDYYERLKQSYDARFYEQEVMGNYLHMKVGRVYHAFERAGNVAAVKLDVNRPLMWALDFNVDPMSAVVAQVVDGRVAVLDEIVLSRATTMQACEEFRGRYSSHGAGLVVYADATGARMQTTGRSDLKVVEEEVGHGEYGPVKFLVPKSNPPVSERVALMNSKLGSAAGVRSLVIDPRCTELIKDFEQVSFKEGSQIVDKEKDPKRTHLSDALGYLVWQEFGDKGRVGERGNRLV